MIKAASYFLKIILRPVVYVIRDVFRTARYYIRFHPHLKSIGQNNIINTDTEIRGQLHLGSNSVVDAIITGEVHIGSRASISHSTLNGPIKIGNNVTLWRSTIDRYSYLAANSVVFVADIGSFCSIAPGVSIGLPTHPMDGISTNPIFFSNLGQCGVKWREDKIVEELLPVSIGADVWIGSNAMIKGGISIGVGAIIGAGAMVCKNVPPYAIVAGVPAKIIRYRFAEDVISLLLESRWWDLQEDVLRDEIGHCMDPLAFLSGVAISIKNENLLLKIRNLKLNRSSMANRLW